ncbi:MAG: DNA repair protein RecO [Halioglobus sp.]|nr:DNA repair protein RecO [Halioglobus sp.]
MNPRMAVRLQPSYILHSRPYRDSSLIVEAFTAEHGRISLVAKGVRATTRRRGGRAALQPFLPLLLSFSGRGELKTLTASEPAGVACTLKGEKVYSALYLNELLVRLLHRHDPHPALFAAYSQALTSLAGDSEPDVALRRFELCLLDELGYSPDLTRDYGDGRPVDALRWYRYVDGHGVQALPSDQEDVAGAYLGSHLLAIARGEFGGDVRPEAKRLLRLVLREHLGEQPLRSRELFQRRRRER